jgi:hypothetical protein
MQAYMSPSRNFTDGQGRARRHADLEVAIAELDALMCQPFPQHVRLS